MKQKDVKLEDLPPIVPLKKKVKKEVIKRVIKPVIKEKKKIEKEEVKKFKISKKEKGKPRNIKLALKVFIILILLGIIIFIGISVYFYFKTPEKTLGIGANIESALLNEQGNLVYVKLLGGSLDKNITKIKFIFTDFLGSEHYYETTEGAVEISVAFKRSFWDWLFGRQFTGIYDYEIKAEEIGLYNFEDIDEVSVSFEYETETGETIETPKLDTTKTTTKTTTTGGGNGNGNGGVEEPPVTCTPVAVEVTCGTWVCGNRNNNCGTSVNCGACLNNLTCVEGICVNSSRNCTDYLGIDFYRKDYAFNGTISWDACTNETNGNLTEFICVGDNVSNITIECEINCTEGKCTCVDECSAEGLLCDGNMSYNCTLNATIGCFEREDMVNCSLTGEICYNGECVGVPAPTQIKVEPGITVEVGEEVFFDGSGVTIAGAVLLDNGMIEGSYEWDFGDGFVMDSSQVAYLTGGTTASHFYTRPGTYTIKLNVIDINNNSKIETIDIIVTGEYPKLAPRASADPILELKFENNLDDSSGNSLNGIWGNASQGNFVNGAENKAVELNETYINISDNLLLDSMNELTVSVWAKKRTVKEGYTVESLVNKEGAYYIKIGEDAGHSTAFMKVCAQGGCTEARQFLADQIKDILWHHYVMTYNGTDVKMYIDGIEQNVGMFLPTGTPANGRVEYTVNNLLIAEPGTYKFDGYIDEIKIYNKSLTQEEISKIFELWHADFHGHTAQYIYAQILGVFTKDPTNKIKVTVTGDTGFSKVIYNKNNLQSEEKFLLNNSELPAGNYTLTVQILDATNVVLEELIEKFEKLYDGIPKVGIDENNAFRMNGELFFPVASWMLTKDNMMYNWKAGKYINTLYGEGYYPEHNISSWKDYLDEGTSYGWGVIGGEFIGGVGAFVQRNNNINKIVESITQTQNHPSLFMWFLGDEPDLANVPSPVLRSRTYKYHKHDNYEHLVTTNYGGGMWASDGSFEETKRKSYEYLYNDRYFGKQTHITDVLGIDYYPIGFREGGTTVEKLALALDRLNEENYNLMPYMSFVETAYLVTTLPPPTSEQLRMLTWLNVVHGVKGINWYPFELPTPPENFAVMAEFLNHSTELTPVILSPEPNRTITDNANSVGNRVDTMIREDENSTYIIAVRLTEVNEIDNITTTFTVEGLTSGMEIIEPGEFSQSILEYQGDSNITSIRNTFSFTLNNIPIIPGTVQVAGQYRAIERGRDDRIYLYDDGNGILYGIPISWQYKNMQGTVNYQTGEGYVDFGVDGVGDNISILPSIDMVRATYRPVKSDRIISQTGDTFTDTFQPNDIHIYKISTAGIPSLSPFTKLWNFLKGLLTRETGKAILTGKITGDAVGDGNGKLDYEKTLIMLVSLIVIIFLFILIFKYRNKKIRKTNRHKK